MQDVVLHELAMIVPPLFRLFRFALWEICFNNGESAWRIVIMPKKEIGKILPILPDLRPIRRSTIEDYFRHKMPGIFHICR